jgi:subtilisin-like proprotein convertase family protein
VFHPLFVSRYRSVPGPRRRERRPAAPRSRLFSVEPLEGRALLAALTLPAGTSYTETFDTLASGLPAGWAVFSGATASSRGTAATLTTAATAWNETTGGFRNAASADVGTSADASATQSSRTDRALAVRQSSGFGDPGAAFELELANTAGRTGFALSVKHQMLDVQPRSTTWRVQYSTSGTSWTNLGTSIDPGTWGSTTATYDFGTALDDRGGPVYVRIAALAASSGSGNRDTCGIDDVTLTWTNAAATTPSITVSPATLAAPLTTTVGTPSAPQSFSVSGARLTGGLTVTAPAGLEVSLAAGSGYATSLDLAATDGAVALTTVYARLAATAPLGNYNKAAITVSGGGAATQNVQTTDGGNAVSDPTSAVLFFEDFAGITTGDNTTTGGSSTSWSGSANWSSVTTAFQAGGAVRLGTGSAAGSITTKSHDLSGNGGVFTVSFDVKGWTSVAGPITVSVTGLAPQAVTYVATMASAFETKTLEFTGGQPDSTITFSVASGQRAFLDNIVVSGGAPMPQVTGIAGFVWDDANGDGVWDAPEEPGIAGRRVYLDLDRDGALGLNEPNMITAEDGSYTFTGLGAGTYVVAMVLPQGWEQTAPTVGDQSRTRSLGGVEVATFTDPAYAPGERQQQRRFLPNDPLFAQQWHLRNTGQFAGTVGQDANVVSAWDAARGTGVVIGIIDDGVQTNHPDLAAAYRADLSYDFNGNDTNPSPGSGDDHGTAVAGVAAARGNNGIGVSGAAPNASIAAIRLIGASTTDQQEANGLTYKPQEIAVYSNSWGPSDTGTILEAPGPLTRAALANAVRTGRGGKGSIYVWAAGNGLANNDNSNYDGYANSRYTIAVTAVDNRGRQSWYAEPGANILVAAPSSGDSSGSDVGVVTTDRTGSAGYNVSASATPGELSDRDYTNDFGGTSSATPLVSGVVALMLEANPVLGWRDVQHILANSARRNDVTDVGWSQNGAGKWVNHQYGFGVVDAAAAVTMAQGWTNVGPEVSAGSGTINVGQTIPDNSAAGITSSFTMGADIRMESVEVVFSATHASRGHLQVVLTSPAGTKSVLAERRSDTGDHYSAWTFSTVRNWDESSKGNWTLTVSDLTSGTTGTFGSWALNVYGTAPPAPPGTQAITVSVGETVAGVNFGTRSLAPPPPPVKVTGVYVRGSTWNSTYLALTPTFTTVGTDHLGWQLRDGSNQLANSAIVSWSNVNRISVRFDQAISLPQAAALTLKAVTGSGVQTITPTAVSLLSGGTVAQFSVSALATGKYVLSIPATGITDAAGTTVLDGEWTTSSSTFLQGSGDNVAGGMFNFSFNVLVGDVVANGTVNGSDRSTASGQLFRAFTTSNFRSNVNGDASINGTDLSVVSGQLFRGLASLAAATAPAASLPSIGLPTSTNATGTGTRLGATVTSDGGEPVLERGVVLVAGTTGTPAAGDAGAITLFSAGGQGTFTVDVTGLTPSTAYRFRAFVRTSLGTVYTSIGTFTTGAGQVG